MKDECRHHEAIEVEIIHLQNSLKEIRAMFATILVGLIVVLVGTVANYRTLTNGNAPVAKVVQAGEIVK